MRQPERDWKRTDPPKAEETSNPAPSPRWVLWVLVAVLLLALVMDLVFYTGFYASDDIQYIRGAEQLAETGRLSYITTGTIRFVLLLPLAAVIKLTHHNLYAMAASFIVFHLLLILATYWVGRLVHGGVTGLLAAGCLAVCPIAVTYSTTILPDHAVTALTLFSLGVLIAAGRRLSSEPPDKRGGYLLCGLSGVLLGLSWGAKVTSVIMLAVYAVMLVAWARRLGLRPAAASALSFAIGLAAAGMLLWGSFHLATGLYLPHQDSRFANLASTASERIAAKTYSTPMGRMTRLASFARSDRDLGPLRWLLPIGLVVYPFLRRRSWLLYLTFFWLCVYMTWGTFSFKSYLPPPVQARYFLLALPFAIIPLAQVIVTFSQRVWSVASRAHSARILAVALAVGLALALVVASAIQTNRTAGNRYYSAEVAGVRYALDYAGQSDERPVVVSGWLSSRMRPLLAGEHYPRVIVSSTSTRPSDFRDLLSSTGFLYLDCSHEHSSSGATTPGQSPLDAEVARALAGSTAQLSVRTLGTFEQFRTRLSAFRYVFGGSGRDMDLRDDKRCVFLREIGPPQRQAEMIADSAGESLDLSHRDAWAPTWVSRVSDCRVRRAEDGSVVCDIVGSNITSGGQYGGISFTTGPVEAVRFDVTFDTPETVGAVFMDLTSGTATRRRLRWQFTPSDQVPLPAGRQTYTFRPGRSAGPFAYAGGPISLQDCDRAHLFVRLKGVNSRAAFRVHRVLVQKPAR